MNRFIQAIICLATIPDGTLAWWDAQEEYDRAWYALIGKEYPRA